jgi:translation initiation factor 1A
MPKNKGAGGKNRRKGKGQSTGPKELVFKEEDQEYGQITKSLGNGYMEVTCFTSSGNVQRRAHIRGNMRKRVWMAAGDIVLVSTRGYQDSTCDIVLKYTSDEARLLRIKHQIPDTVEINKNDEKSEDIPITFDDDNSESDDNEENNKKIKIIKQNRNLDLPPTDDSDTEINLDDL